MQADYTAPITEAEIALRHKEWEAYREECFIRAGVPEMYVWCAAAEFDFQAPALQLLHVPGTSVALGSVALGLHAFGAHHVIPIVRLSAISLTLLQGLSEAPLADVRQALEKRQEAAEWALQFSAQERWKWQLQRSLPDSAASRNPAPWQ